MAQEVATPAGTPAGADPAALLYRLLAAPVESPLFPRDTGENAPVTRTDEGDTDLVGTIGSVLMQTRQESQKNVIEPGVYRVSRCPSSCAVYARSSDRAVRCA